MERINIPCSGPSIRMPKPPSTLFAAALAAVTLIGPLSIHLFLPALPQVKDAFGISDGLAQFTFSITLFTMAGTTLVYGALSDHYGRRPVLLSGLTLFLVGIALAVWAPTIELFILGRLIQAVGAGCGVALARLARGDAFACEQHRRKPRQHRQRPQDEPAALVGAGEETVR